MALRDGASNVSTAIVLLLSSWKSWQLLNLWQFWESEPLFMSVFFNFQISLCVVKLRVIVAETFILSLVGQVSSLFFRKVELQGLKINTSSWSLSIKKPIRSGITLNISESRLVVWFGYLTGQWKYWLIAGLANWLTDWPTHCLTHCLTVERIDWLID